MVQMTPGVRSDLKKLRKISHSLIRNQSAGVVNIPIKDLSNKDLGRALFISVNSFAELANKQKVIIKVINQAMKDIRDVLENDKLTREEIVEKIREISLDPADLEERSSESDSSSDKES